jgi:transketolase
LESEGISVNVVSLPSWDRFLALTASERNAIIPTSHPRVSVEAGSTFGWAAIASHSVGIDRFGASAPGNVVMEKLGISAANVAATVKAALSQ